MTSKCESPETDEQENMGLNRIHNMSFCPYHGDCPKQPSFLYPFFHSLNLLSGQSDKFVSNLFTEIREMATKEKIGSSNECGRRCMALFYKEIERVRKLGKNVRKQDR